MAAELVWKLTAWLLQSIIAQIQRAPFRGATTVVKLQEPDVPGGNQESTDKGRRRWLGVDRAPSKVRPLSTLSLATACG